jgi:iron complex outermembrane receptor protein
MKFLSRYKCITRAIPYPLIASIACLVVASSFCQAVFAQQEEEVEEAGLLEQVTVTAQRRAESLQDVPISVTVFNAEDLREANVRILSDIATRTPGFAMGVFNFGQPQLYIRGIGSNADGAGSDSSVVVFLDEVYIGRATAANIELYDLERFEVLRGPQGTLFGKNVIGGAMNLVTTRPTDVLTGKFEATAGNLGLLEAKGLVSGPLSEKIAGKFSFTTRKRDGYITSVDPTIKGEKYSDIESTGVRGALRITASETVEINLSADYSWDRYGAAGHRLSGVDQALILPSGQVAYDPEAYADVYNTFSDFPDGFQDRDVWGLMGRVDWDVGRGTFTSITAFCGAEYEFNEDHVGSGFATTPILSVQAYIDEEVDQFTQEFRFNRVDFNDRVNWTIGAFYLDEDIDRQENSLIALFMPRPLPADISLQSNTTESWSIFADMTWSITDRFDLTLGGRYTDEKKNIRQVGIDGALGGVVENYDVTASESWDAFTPRLVLGYHVSDDAYVYASYSEGFKSGGFEGLAATAVGAATPFDPEEAKAYEGGLKSEWFENRLRVNAAVFKTDYTDLQVLERITTPDDPIGIVITKNAGKAKIKGAEIEFASQWGNFGLNGNYAYIDTETKEFGGPDDPRNGKRLRNSPKNSYYITANYNWRLSSGADVNIRYDYRHQDKVYSDPLNIEGSAIPGYSLQDFRVAYVTAGGGWELAAWVNNLADKEYLLHAWPAAPFGYIQTYAPPRTYGVTFSMTFGG